MVKKSEKKNKKQKVFLDSQARNRRNTLRNNQNSHHHIQEQSQQKLKSLKKAQLPTTSQKGQTISQETRKRSNNKQEILDDQLIMINEQNQSESLGYEEMHNPIIAAQKFRSQRSNKKTLQLSENMSCKNLEQKQCQINPQAKNESLLNQSYRTQNIVNLNKNNSSHDFNELHQIQKQKEVNKMSALLLANPDTNPKYKNFISKKSFFKKKKSQNCQEISNQSSLLYLNHQKLLKQSNKPLNQKMQTQNSTQNLSIPLNSNINRQTSNSVVINDRNNKILNIEKEDQNISSILGQENNVNSENRFCLKKKRLKLDSKVVVQSIYIRVISNIQNQESQNTINEAKKYQKKSFKKPVNEYYQSTDNSYFYTKVVKTRNRNCPGKIIQRYREILIEQDESNASYYPNTNQACSDNRQNSNQGPIFEEALFKKQYLGNSTLIDRGKFKQGKSSKINKFHSNFKEQ